MLRLLTSRLGRLKKGTLGVEARFHHTRFLLGVASATSVPLSESENAFEQACRKENAPAATATTTAGHPRPKQLLSIWPLLLTSSRHQQRSFSTQASGGNKMATAQTIQQRSSLDLALANPVYQGVCGVGCGWCYCSTVLVFWAQAGAASYNLSLYR